jgi:hypothetical protein
MFFCTHTEKIVIKAKLLRTLMEKCLSEREKDENKKNASELGKFLDNDIPTNADRKAVLLCEPTLKMSNAIKFACAHFHFPQVYDILKNLTDSDKYIVLSEFLK